MYSFYIKLELVYFNVDLDYFKIQVACFLHFDSKWSQTNFHI